MNLIIDSHPYHYEMEALCRMFLRGEELKILETAQPPAEDFLYTGVSGSGTDGYGTAGDKVAVRANYKGKTAEETADAGSDAERAMARAVYSVMSTLTGIRPKWGVLTGIRPVKLAMELADEGRTPEEIRRILSTDRLISDEKIALMLETMLREREIRQSSRPESVSLYISIPFCPTRCSYCSFISHSIEKAAKLIPPYVELLCEELRGIAELIEELGLRLETVYMGGGTPSVLSAEQLDAVLGTVESSFNMRTVRELTVEAGRPDTITPEKLEAMIKHHVGRISVNPQTLDDEVMEAIGRKHTAAQFLEAFRLARSLGFDNINTDLIAGLPKDNMEKFSRTIEGIMELRPENVTLHTLTVKRAAGFGSDPEGILAGTADGMVEFAQRRFGEEGYFPYYLYRQKGTVDNLENTGYCLPGREGLYNIFIMDETHSILAAGAGGVTKLKAPGGTRIERIFNFKYPYEYIGRFDQIHSRKDQIREFYETWPVRAGI